MKLTIPIDAVPQKRADTQKGSKRRFDPDESRKFKHDFAILVKMLRPNSALLTGELKVELNIFRNFKKATNQHYGDIDNLVKSIFDALTGVVWKDDRQVVDLHVTKKLSATPYVELFIEEVI